jgi:caffeoyl-CoA O-methyltransferase
MPTYNEQLERYLRETFSAEDEVLSTIRETIPQRGLPAITVKPEEGRFLQFLVAASRAQLALEIGTLGGYSGVWIARGLPANGRLITLEKEPAHAAVAEEHFELAGVATRVDIRIGNAHALLPSLAPEGPYDFIFIDAEKDGYPAYLDWAQHNLRPGGIVAAHNAFRGGRVADPSLEEDGLPESRTFNTRLATDGRFISTVFPAGDGTAIGVLRPAE